jgi:long-chain-fatty-acid--CoA ligase ACSBG
MLSHDAVVWENVAIFNSALDSRPELATPDNRAVSYLPLSHIAALGIDVLSHYVIGFEVYFAKPDAL